LANEVRRGEVELRNLREVAGEARSNTVWGSSSEMLESEIAVQQAALEDLRSQVREHLDVVHSLLEVTRDIPPDISISDEIEDLRSELIEYQERETPVTDPKRKLRRVIREWMEVVGSADDIDATILDRSYALAATCLYVGNRQMEDMTFDWVIVDEAGRATLPELLIPLVRGQRIVLIGDERQLPPMVTDPPSDDWFNSNGLDHEIVTKSFFEELLIRGEIEHPELIGMLDVQHRMHPGIGDLISNVFYEGRLKHGISSSEREHGFHWIPRPVMWYSTDVIPSHFESRRGTSFVNLSEVEVIASLLEHMEESCLSTGASAEVGIISGYAAQIDELTSRVRPRDSFRWRALSIEIATVDAFQGRDRDIIIYSAVRSNSDGRVGFLARRQRLNVAMSRARKLLIIVGDATMLERAKTKDDNPFADIIGHIRGHSEACQLVTWHRNTTL
jgi:superfamily I DNA and/or RNA helicase